MDYLSLDQSLKVAIHDRKSAASFTRSLKVENPSAVVRPHGDFVGIDFVRCNDGRNLPTNGIDLIDGMFAVRVGDKRPSVGRPSKTIHASQLVRLEHAVRLKDACLASFRG